MAVGPGRFLFCERTMLREMREKLGAEIEQLSHELNVVIPQAIAQAVELGDLRENSEYKAALERQQFVQARLGQLHLRLAQVSQLSTGDTPAGAVGLGSRVTVVDLDTREREDFMLVLAEMMDIEAGHISLASPLGRALKGRKVGDEIELRLPRGQRRLKVLEIGPG
jgi:transcription elongation factor GreA